MLKTLILRKEKERLTAEQAELRTKKKSFKTREDELEKDLNEAESEEDIAVVREAVEKLTAEMEETDKRLAEIEARQTELDNEIKELEEKVVQTEGTEDTEPSERKERNERSTRSMRFDTSHLRSLPRGASALKSMPEAYRNSLNSNEQFNSFMKEIRGVIAEKRNVAGGDLTIPTILLDVIIPNQIRYSKLLNRVRVEDIPGIGRQTVAGAYPEAIWTEMCGAINELTFDFNQVEVDGYKVAGFIPVCNSLLELSDFDLAAIVVEMLSEGIGLATDKAILYGKGAIGKMPLGIVTRLAQTSQPENYPATAPKWINLSTTNIVKINSADLTPVQFMQQLVMALSNTANIYNRGRLFLAMNSKTYAQVQAALIALTYEGDVVSKLGGVMPILDADIDVLEFMPDGDIVGGYGDMYLFSNRTGMSIDADRSVQFIQDNTVFRGKRVCDGTPVIAQSFIAININNVNPTTVMTFPADTANDADLTGLTIGSETLAPVFSAGTLTYSVTASAASDVVTATPAQANASVAISYNGANVENGSSIKWATGTKALTITVKNGNKVKVYTVNVTK